MHSLPNEEMEYASWCDGHHPPGFRSTLLWRMCEKKFFAPIVFALEAGSKKNDSDRFSSRPSHAMNFAVNLYLLSGVKWSLSGG
jgi:hypothetical protein